jgi:hypothetical protein
MKNDMRNEQVNPSQVPTKKPDQKQTNQGDSTKQYHTKDKADF